MKRNIYIFFVCICFVSNIFAKKNNYGPHKDPDRNEIWRVECSIDYYKSYICPQGYDSCLGEVRILTGPTPYTYRERYIRPAQEITQDSIYNGILHAYYFYDKNIVFLIDTAAVKRHGESGEPMVIPTLDGRAALSAKYISLIGFDDGLLNIRYKGLLFIKK